MDHRGKGKFNDHDTEGWRRKPRTPEIIGAATSSNMETVSGPYFVGEGAEFSSVSSVLRRVEGKSVTETFDSTDIQAQVCTWFILLLLFLCMTHGLFLACHGIF